MAWSLSLLLPCSGKHQKKGACLPELNGTHFSSVCVCVFILCEIEADGKFVEAIKETTCLNSKVLCSADVETCRLQGIVWWVIKVHSISHTLPINTLMMFCTSNYCAALCKSWKRAVWADYWLHLSRQRHSLFLQRMSLPRAKRAKRVILPLLSASG